MIYLTIVISILFFYPLNAISAEKFQLWNSSIESQRDIIAFENVDFPYNKISPQDVLDYLFNNKKQFGVKIILVKNDVAYVNIEKDPDYITNRSGSTGAFHFGAKVVFNLTEFDNIKYVYFVDEGSHFSMGKRERLDYWYLMTDYRKRINKGELESRLNAKDCRVHLYVEKLAEVGDENSIHKLEALKRQCKSVGSGCDDGAINKAVKEIESRLIKNNVEN